MSQQVRHKEPPPQRGPAAGQEMSHRLKSCYRLQRYFLACWAPSSGSLFGQICSRTCLLGTSRALPYTRVPAYQLYWEERDRVQNAGMGSSTKVLNLEDKESRGRGLAFKMLASHPSLHKRPPLQQSTVRTVFVFTACNKIDFDFEKLSATGGGWIMCAFVAYTVDTPRNT